MKQRSPVEAATAALRYIDVSRIQSIEEDQIIGGRQIEFVREMAERGKE